MVGHDSVNWPAGLFQAGHRESGGFGGIRAVAGINRIFTFRRHEVNSKTPPAAGTDEMVNWRG